MQQTVEVRQASDLREVEMCLRAMYNTQPGQACQALLSTAYQLWTQDVRQQLRNPGKASTLSTLSTLSTPNMPAGKQIEQTVVETYLPNYHLVFVANSCSISFIPPTVPRQANKKRGRDAD